MQAGGAEDSRMATTRYALARALWEVPESRPRALVVAGQARGFYRDRGDEGEDLVGITAWIAAHGGQAGP